ncbi:aldo/keto reductase [Mycena crocata]|nr:aldo/keto reductase [Mycena crocata]
MVQKTTKLGGTASDVTVGRCGNSSFPVKSGAHGLMMMTWSLTPASDDQCFEAIKTGVDALPAGTKAFLNSGEFYAKDLGTGNLEMLSRFYAKYPEYAAKTFLSVKGAAKNLTPDNSPSVANIQKVLGPIKNLDLFEPARIDRDVPIEDMMQTLATLVKEGKFAHIGLSECNADTLRKAHAVHPMTAVEIEISPFSYEQNQKKVIETAAELGISVLAPLGHELLTGNFKSQADIAEGDLRGHLTRFKEENLKHNVSFVEALDAVAQRKGLAVAQLPCLDRGFGPRRDTSPRIIVKSTRTLENLQAGDVELSADELNEMNGIIAKYGVKGDRSVGLPDEQMHLWG